MHRDTSIISCCDDSRAMSSTNNTSIILLLGMPCTYRSLSYGCRGGNMTKIGGDRSCQLCGCSGSRNLNRWITVINLSHHATLIRINANHGKVVVEGRILYSNRIYISQETNNHLSLFIPMKAVWLLCVAMTTQPAKLCTQHTVYIFTSVTSECVSFFVQHRIYTPNPLILR